MKPKTLNGLMKYMRDEKGIAIAGGQKRKLKNIGYYHGYKGYRYQGKSTNKLNYSDFNELMSVYDFDMELKVITYPKIMFLETAIKNYTLEIILEEAKSSNFNDIYSKCLLAYKEEKKGSTAYRKRVEKRLNLRNQIYNSLTRDYRNGKTVVQHFFHKDANPPIWAIFEIISMGDLGTFISCMNRDLRIDLSKDLGINTAYIGNGEVATGVVYTLKELRNAVAHNEAIFDTRFKTGEIRGQLKKCIEADTGITGINFNSIVDYFILIAYMLKNLRVSKTEIKQFIGSFKQAIEKLRKNVPISLYNKIIPTDTRKKIQQLEVYVSKK